MSIWTIRQLNYFNNSLFDFYSSLYYIFVRFTLYWILGDYWISFNCGVTLFQCFQECVIRLIVKVTYYSQCFVDCIGSLLTVYANCIIFLFIFECQGIVVLYMKWANCVFGFVLFIWMRYKFLYLIFLNCAKSMIV